MFNLQELQIDTDYIIVIMTCSEWDGKKVILMAKLAAQFLNQGLSKYVNLLCNGITPSVTITIFIMLWKWLPTVTTDFKMSILIYLLFHYEMFFSTVNF